MPEILICIRDDGQNDYVRISKDPNYQDDNKLMYVVDWNDCMGDAFETYNEAFVQFMEYLERIIDNREECIFNNREDSRFFRYKFDNTDTIENYDYISSYFLRINEKFINKDIRKKLIGYNLVLCYSDKIYKFRKKQLLYKYSEYKYTNPETTLDITKLIELQDNTIYIMSLSMFNNIKDTFKFKEINNKYNNISKGEQICKDILNELYPNYKFTKLRPDWLKNDLTQKNLELDMYNKTLKIAVEFNGEQHYKFIPYFHKDIETFEKQKQRDRLKEEKCNQNNIKLICVPYYLNNSEIKEFIINKILIKN